MVKLRQNITCIFLCLFFLKLGLNQVKLTFKDVFAHGEYMTM